MPDFESAGVFVTEPAKLSRAAYNILTRTFGLRRDQNLLIFADVASLEVVEVVARVARELGITTTALFVPRVLQLDMGPSESLPLPAEAAVREADAILSCLSDHPEHLHYRMRVLHASWGRRARLAHAPGMTVETLKTIDTDYAAIAEQAQLLSLALILGKRVEIVTTDSQRREHRLNVRVGGWDYPPGINDGTIREGAWSNLPPGEVYIVPRDGDGQIVVNGSIPGKVLGPAEELILTFRDGRMVDMQPEDSAAARHLHESQIAYAERRGDGNWSNLAEVGFGLNPAVQDLTGLRHRRREEGAHGTCRDWAQRRPGRRRRFGHPLRHDRQEADGLRERPADHEAGRLADQRGRLAARSPHGDGAGRLVGQHGPDCAQRRANRARVGPADLRVERGPRPLGQRGDRRGADRAACRADLRPAARERQSRSARRAWWLWPSRRAFPR